MECETQVALQSQELLIVEIEWQAVIVHKRVVRDVMSPSTYGESGESFVSWECKLALFLLLLCTDRCCLGADGQSVGVAMGGVYIGDEEVAGGWRLSACDAGIRCLDLC